MPGMTLYDKSVASHEVVRIDDEHISSYVDSHIMNEYTSPQAFSGSAARGRDVSRPGQQMAVVDHIIPTHPVPAASRVIPDDASSRQARNLKRNCDEQRIASFDTTDPSQGIEHVIAPEHGMISPGMVVSCGDSHTTTYGASGASGFGIGTSEVEHISATQTSVYRVARNMRIRVDGRSGVGVSAKDSVIYVVHRIGAQGARGAEGPQGKQGPVGAQGPRGEQGPPGRSRSFEEVLPWSETIFDAWEEHRRTREQEAKEREEQEAAARHAAELAAH
ncbi:hypothetical protein OY671_008396, partial [Metschnikowia pulcherrima]